MHSITVYWSAGQVWRWPMGNTSSPSMRIAADHQFLSQLWYYPLRESKGQLKDWADGLLILLAIDHHSDHKHLPTKLACSCECAEIFSRSIVQLPIQDVPQKTVIACTNKFNRHLGKALTSQTSKQILMWKHTFCCSACRIVGEVPKYQLATRKEDIICPIGYLQANSDSN